MILNLKDSFRRISSLQGICCGFGNRIRCPLSIQVMYEIVHLCYKQTGIVLCLITQELPIGALMFKFNMISGDYIEYGKSPIMCCQILKYNTSLERFWHLSCGKADNHHFLRYQVIAVGNNSVTIDVWHIDYPQISLK